jgi:DNA polymerase delta subunit 2
MLPLSSKLSTTRLVTNPYALSVNDVSILGSSGQNVDDVRKYSDLDSPLDIMDNMLQWAHLAPTAPDTLNCYPFKERDAFTIDNQPHVFFTGNQDKFACRVVQDKGVKTLLVSVPSFTTDPALVLVNLRTLACHPIYFNINNEWI